MNTSGGGDEHVKDVEAGVLEMDDARALAIVHIPQADGGVLSGAGQPAGVNSEQAVDASRVSKEHANAAAISRVPRANARVPRGTRHAKQRHVLERRDECRVAAHRPHARARRHIPHAHRVVARAAREQVNARPFQAHHAARVTREARHTRAALHVPHVNGRVELEATCHSPLADQLEREHTVLPRVDGEQTSGAAQLPEDELAVGPAADQVVGTDEAQCVDVLTSTTGAGVKSDHELARVHTPHANVARRGAHDHAVARGGRVGWSGACSTWFCRRGGGGAGACRLSVVFEPVGHDGVHGRLVEMHARVVHEREEVAEGVRAQIVRRDELVDAVEISRSRRLTCWRLSCLGRAGEEQEEKKQRGARSSS